MINKSSLPLKISTPVHDGKNNSLFISTNMFHDRNTASK
jgi:hypothetical protein